MTPARKWRHQAAHCGGYARLAACDRHHDGERDDRTGALLAFSTHNRRLSAVKNVLADSAYTGEPFAAGVHKYWGQRWKSSSATNCTSLSPCQNAGSSSAPLHGWKMSAFVEKLRTQTQYQFAVRRSGFPAAIVEKIENRFLGLKFCAIRCRKRQSTFSHRGGMA